MATPDRSCGGSNPATPPPVEAPRGRSIALIPETPDSSRAVLTDLTPATPVDDALEGSACGHVAALDPSPAGSGGLQHQLQDTPRPEKALLKAQEGRQEVALVNKTP